MTTVSWRNDEPGFTDICCIGFDTDTPRYVFTPLTITDKLALGFAEAIGFTCTPRGSGVAREAAATSKTLVTIYKYELTLKNDKRLEILETAPSDKIKSYFMRHDRIINMSFNPCSEITLRDHAEFKAVISFVEEQLSINNQLYYDLNDPNLESTIITLFSDLTNLL